MNKPWVPHLKAAHRVPLGQGIFLPTTSSIQTNAFCHTDWARCRDTRRSINGYRIFLGNSLISYKSKTKN